MQLGNDIKDNYDIGCYSISVNDDIDMAAKVWMSPYLDGSKSAFNKKSLVIDGNGHTISNLSAGSETETTHQGFIRYAAGKPAGSSYRMNAANHYFPGCEKKHHPMKRIQASAIRWVKKFCLGRSRAKNISATMNNTMVAMAIRPATLRFFIIVYLRCSASGSLCTSSHSPLWWHIHFRNSIPSTIVRIPRTYVP